MVAEVATLTASRKNGGNPNLVKMPGNDVFLACMNPTGFYAGSLGTRKRWFHSGARLGFLH
jgi:hypothetical protein